LRYILPPPSEWVNGHPRTRLSKRTIYVGGRAQRKQPIGAKSAGTAKPRAWRAPVINLRSIYAASAASQAALTTMMLRPRNRYQMSLATTRFRDGRSPSGKTGVRMQNKVRFFPKGRTTMEKKSKEDTRASAAVRELRSRRTYIQLRVPKIREEMKGVAETRDRISKAMKEDNLGPEKMRTLNEQRIYAIHELARLKAEASALGTERKQVLERLKATGREGASAPAGGQ